jgi:hypothetical protein
MRCAGLGKPSITFSPTLFVGGEGERRRGKGRRRGKKEGREKERERGEEKRKEVGYRLI